MTCKTAASIPYAGPAVRILARELGIDLTQVTPTGPHGRIIREDLLAFVRESRKGAATTAAHRMQGDPALAFGVTLPAWPEPDYSKFGKTDNIELSRIQKLSAGNLARNWVTIPHVTNFDKADVTETEEFRKSLNKKPDEGARVTMLAFLIKAAVSALKAYPRFNVSFAQGSLVQKHYYNIGFAADTPNGLVVAVIHDADRKGIVQIAAEARDLAAKARQGTLSPHDMTGGCFTISSLGGIGGTGFTPIINAPEISILGAVRAEMQPVWDGKSFVPRLVMPLSLSWDHRAVDGAMAARFLAHICDGLRDARNLAL